MDIISIVLGGALLLFGRILYWLFVGVVGFYLGSYIATNLLEGEAALVTVIGIAAGVIGIAMAYVIQYMAIGLAGFVLGGFLATQLIDYISIDVGNLSWLAFVAGGIVGVMLVGFLFDWALIILSSFAGAALLVDELPIDEDLYLWAFFGLVLLGVIIQGVIRWTQQPQKEEDQEPIG